jgi:hypothetical protein
VFAEEAKVYTERDLKKYNYDVTDAQGRATMERSRAGGTPALKEELKILDKLAEVTVSNQARQERCYQESQLLRQYEALMYTDPTNLDRRQRYHSMKASYLSSCGR